MESLQKELKQTKQPSRSKSRKSKPQPESFSDRDYDIWKFQFEKLHSGVMDAGKSVNRHSLTLALIVCIFSIITYGNFITEKITVPLISLELSKWNAAILGPSFISMSLYTFACSRTLHQMRLKALLEHISILYNKLPESHPLRFEKPDFFLGYIIYPSTYMFQDFFIVKEKKLLSVVIWLFIIVWFLTPPILQLHISDTVLAHFSWNIFLVVLYVVCLFVSLYSMLTVLDLHKSKFTWDFS